MDTNAKQQIVEKLKTANNVLVAVSSSPSVDQLSAAIGLTLMLNKLEKHATAVYSGSTPSTIEFLKPENTLQKTTDSLQDFIISLDRSKADKLRYKVEDDVVRIFITPYRTNITGADLNFSQGDFNIDVVIALGVDEREHLDQAITSHGRILHDATVMTVMAGNQVSNIGSVNWQEPSASSLCEMLVSISESFQSGLLDAQMSTAFLTGIVAETERFKNAKTSPKVMTMSAQLMAAGANQQLIADSLAKPVETQAEPKPEPEKNSNKRNQQPKKTEPQKAVKQEKQVPLAESMPKTPEPNKKPEPNTPESEPSKAPKHPENNKPKVKTNKPTTPQSKPALKPLIVPPLPQAIPEDQVGKPKDSQSNAPSPPKQTEKKAQTAETDTDSQPAADALAFSMHDKAGESVEYKTAADTDSPEEDEQSSQIHIDDNGKFMSSDDIDLTPVTDDKPKPAEPEPQPATPKPAEPSKTEGPTGGQSFINNKTKKVIQPLPPAAPEATLSDIEQKVQESAPPLPPTQPGGSSDNARTEVENALAEDIPNQQPAAIQALNAQPIEGESVSVAPPPLPPPPVIPPTS